jgi:hypothetical protein
MLDNGGMVLEVARIRSKVKGQRLKASSKAGLKAGRPGSLIALGKRPKVVKTESTRIGQRA